MHAVRRAGLESPLRRARALARPLARRIDLLRTITVRSGPAAGMRLARADASNAYADGTVEAAVQRAVAESLRPGGVFVDVGANVGFFSLLAARHLGARGTIVAFEAHPRVAATLRRNLARNSVRADVRAVAVGAVDGRTTLHVAAHPGGSTIAADAATDEVSRVAVDVVTLDRLVEAGSIPVPDVVKIDVEGAEDAVLDGLERTARAHAPTLVIELDDELADRLERRVDATAARLVGWGYRVDRLPDGYEGGGWSVAHLHAVHADRPARSAPDDRPR